MRENGVIPPPDPALVARFRRDVAALTGPEPGALGVAVSGGADSLALLLLANAAFPECVLAATVDHRLRSEAAAEAAFVSETCRKLSVPHKILAISDREVESLRKSGNVQATARRWRYGLLRRWSSEHDVRWLLTAHHADDQAETLLMRLNRGAGVGGLVGIRSRLAYSRHGGEPRTHVDDPVWMIVRPLLGFRKAELEDVCRRAGLSPVVDPSNGDDRYDRTAARRLLNRDSWLDASRLSESAHHLGDAEDALHWAVEQEKVRRQAGGDGAGHRFTYDMDGLPHEFVRRIAADAIHSICSFAEPKPQQPALRGDELDRLIKRVHEGVASTLGHALVRRSGCIWRFTPAPPRRSH